MTEKAVVVLGVTGSIAAYKAAELTRLMIKKNWEVWVMMTEAATQFVGPLTFQALTGNTVAVGCVESVDVGVYRHLDLANRADVLLIAPCTANVLAKLAHGLADDVVSATALACRSPLLIAPAMNEKMWLHPATQDNVAIIKRRGARMLSVESGDLACGETGQGRLCELSTIVEAVQAALAESHQPE